MIAAGRAAKNKGPLPPQLWKAQHAAQPTWSEFDHIPYREIITVTVLQNVYNTVSIWAQGKATKVPGVAEYYAQLVAGGIVGKNI